MIDFCVLFQKNENIELLVKLFFETFCLHIKNENIKLHLIFNLTDDDKQYFIKIKSYIEKKLKSCNFEYYIYDLIKQNMQDDDIAINIEFMLNNCGKEQWVIIAHNDLNFHHNVIPLFMTYMKDDVSQVGDHNCGIVAYNRNIYCKISMFHHGAPFYAVPINDGTNEYKLIFASTSYRRDGEIRIRGFDVGEIYNILSRCYDYDVIQIGNKILEYDGRVDYCLEHIGGQSLHDDESINKELKEKLINKILNKGISIEL